MSGPITIGIDHGYAAKMCIRDRPTSDGYAGTFKVLYPASSVEGQSGNVQLSLSAPVAQYAAMYAVCQEKDKYGELQNYICDLDNNVRLDVAAISSYANGGEPGPDETCLLYTSSAGTAWSCPIWPTAAP